MKRRSPWLTFAACALLNGTLLGERAPKNPDHPRLAFSMAASAVEAELEKRGLARDHTVSSMSMISSHGVSYYVADIEPPICTPSASIAERLAFQVEMDGRVTEKRVNAGRGNIRRITPP